MKTKKLQFFLIALFCTASLTACQKNDDINGNHSESGSQQGGEAEKAGEAEERSESEQPEIESADTVQSEQTQTESMEEKFLAEQKEMYDLSIEALDHMLAENRGQVQEEDSYLETIGSIYLCSKSYSGGLQADHNEDGANAFQIIMTEDDTEERQRYECRLLSDGSLWFTYQTESACEKDLPDYIVNEDVLRYSRVDYVYDDGETDLEEKKKQRRQEAEQSMAEKTDGEVQEFWCCQENLYRIDRNEGIFVDVTAEKEGCIADFLWEQLRRINCQSAVSEASLEAVEKYKPEGYSLLWGKNSWDDIAVCDLNHDGRMDYVAVLYPDDYEEVRRYEDFSPYEKSPQYYAACFWLLLSSEDGGYEQIGLSNSIEYWEDALNLAEVTFVDEGILQLEYFIGRSPFTNAQLQFQYDEEQKDFYILFSYYRDSFDDSLLIGDVENYGRTNMISYFAWRQNYCEGNWQSADDALMWDGTMLGYYSDSFQYRCENLMEEHLINSRIWEKEYELLQTLKRHYPDRELDVHIVADPTFYNQRLVSGRVELYGYMQYDRTVMPIMVDKQSGEYVTVTGLIDKEDFMRIFADWSDDALLYNSITAVEKALCVEVIEKSWEKADTVEHYFGEKEEILFLQMVEEGVQIGIWSETDAWMDYYIIEKEYFWGTEIWEYLMPDMRQQAR
ncbi:MAG: hypothetical protein K2H40_14015 [Lachnospiraceae bacterium]|nr:hypothetical protein [Lachnospiraceae bacterium]